MGKKFSLEKEKIRGEQSGFQIIKGAVAAQGETASEVLEVCFKNSRWILDPNGGLLITASGAAWGWAGAPRRR